MIASVLLGLLLGTLAGTILVGWYGFERQAQVYSQLVKVLERQRDEARHEAKVFRRLVMPIYDKAESSIAAGSADLRQPMSAPAPDPAKVDPSAGAAAHNTPTAHPLLNRSVPFRIRFKQAARATNTKQKATDTLAAALSSQKTLDAKKFVEEKLNA